MTLAIVYTRAHAGIAAPLVTVETHISYGMPGLHIVGLPEKAVKESKDRVRSALMNTEFEFPARRMTVNLAPADLPKDGGRFDLPIALGILAASGQIPLESLAQYEFTGELALSGGLRPVSGVLPMVLSVKQAGRTLIVPHANVAEAALAQHSVVLSAQHLLEVCAFLRNQATLSTCALANPVFKTTLSYDLAEVKGQPYARRALEIAAAGKHSLLFVGPPGTGKTMLSMRLPTILPSLTHEQALEVATIASVSSRGFDPNTWQHIPVRAPHHSCSSMAMVGGGRPPKPGEISLAHHGVLFLDELPEFSRSVLEALREPLESGQITVSRAAFQTTFPAKFQLVAAMNPCPCGYAGSSQSQCRCTIEHIERYLAKLSGPLLDRIDMHVEVANLPHEILVNMQQDQRENSQQVRARVLFSRQRQLQRQGKCNVDLTTQELEKFCQLGVEPQHLLNQVVQKLNLSARACHRLLKIARTIADLADDEMITSQHLSEALVYRCLDKLKFMR
ncbi:MAG: ATP-dependent protease [Gammaproteobacteria bacterium RIFCSPHIGHO2_12_FULL_41_20]|nr:MAG: ATP-dependent protease [Gammaproteobacteria bacterium RIFCSPHIGHO2_12_FULL_41_20]